MSLFGPPNIKKLAAKGKLEEIIKALSYENDERIVVEAAEALGKMMDSRAVDPLMQVIKKKRTNEIQKACFTALTQIGEPSWQRIIGLLGTSYIHNLNSFVEWALKPIGSPAVEILISKLNRPSIKRDIIVILVKLKDNRAVRPLIDILEKSYDTNLLNASELTLMQKVNLRADAESSKIRGITSWALGKIGDRRALNPLIIAWHDPDETVRNRAAVALSSLGWEPDNVDDKIRFLAARYEGNKENFELIEACIKLGESAITPLKVLLRDKHSSHWEQQFAQQSFKHLGESALLHLVREKDTRSIGFMFLQEIGWKPNNDEASAIWWACHRANYTKCIEFGEIAVPYLLEELFARDKLFNWRLAAVSAIERIGGDEAEEGLSKIAEPSLIIDWLKLTDIEKMNSKEVMKLAALDEKSVLEIVSALEKIEFVKFKKIVLMEYLAFLKKTENIIEKDYKAEKDFDRSLGVTMGRDRKPVYRNRFDSVFRMKVRISEALKNISG